jgi:hypothetical protein
MRRVRKDAELTHVGAALGRFSGADLTATLTRIEADLKGGTKKSAQLHFYPWVLNTMRWPQRLCSSKLQDRSRS